MLGSDFNFPEIQMTINVRVFSAVGGLVRCFRFGAFLGIRLGLGWTKKDPQRYPSTSLIIDILIKSTNYKVRRVAEERTVKDRNLRTEITSFKESGDKRFHYLG